MDGVRTLVLAGTIRQRSPLGEYATSVTTTLVNPASFRRDVTLPVGGVVSSILTPEGGFVTGVLGTFELSPVDRERLEAGSRRYALSLLKARHDPIFRASAGAALHTGSPGDGLVIRVASSETTLLLDPEGRIVEVAFTGPALSDASKTERIRVV